jgi:apolipoprotein N-acyltransferase
MKDLTTTTTIAFNVNKINPLWYLAMGIATMALTHMSFSIEVVAWVSSVPFLIYLALTKGWKSRLTFFLALVIAWSCVVTKIVTDPIPIGMVFLYSIPISLFQLPGYLLWSKFKNQKHALFVFPASMVIMEWIQYSFTPFASWGIAAYTQHDNLPLIQTVSLFGLGGLSFLIYWVNASIANIIVKRKFSFSTLQLPTAVMLVLIIFGAVRYNISKTKIIETITVAAIGTDSEVSGLPLPTTDNNQRIKSALFNRTRVAANGGAKIISWTEASAFVMPENVAEWVSSLQNLVAELDITDG